MTRSAFSKLAIATLAAVSLPTIERPALAQSATAAEAPLAEIIVTARRRNESLMSTPVAVSALNTATIESKAALNIGDLNGAAPNVLVTQQNAGAATANFSIRGLSYADVEKSQDPTVGVVIDGVFIGTSTGQFQDYFDIDQIEVLRGPQGTLFGRNTIGGVVNIRRSRPTGKYGAKLEVSYGSFNTLATRAVVNAPIGDTGLAAKVFYFHNRSDGWYHNAISGNPAGGSKDDHFGGTLQYTSQDNAFDALFTVEKQITSVDPVVASLTNSSELFCSFIPANQCNRNNTTDLYTVFNSPAFSHYHAPSGTLEMNYQLGGVKLTSITGFRESNEDQTQDFDASSVDLYYTHRQQKYHQLSQELRAAGKFTDTFDYVVGGYFFSSRYQLEQHTRLFAFNTAENVDAADPNPQLVNGRTKSYAAFGDFNWAIYDKFRVSFGGRYTEDKKYLDNGFGGVLIGQGDAKFKKFTPKAGIDYRPNEDTMLYFSWSRGYRSGGFSPRASTAATASTPYQPETVDSYEIGTKLDMLERHLQLSLAAFAANYNHMQQNTTIPGGPTGNQTITTNVGGANIKGIEADFAARATDNLRLNGSIGYLHSKFHDFIAGNLIGTSIRPFDYSANDLIYNPSVTLALGADYTIPTDFGDVVTNIGYRYIAPYDQQISLGPLTGNTGPVSNGGSVIVNGNDPRVRTHGQNIIDASISTHFDIHKTKAKITAYVRNLADDRDMTHGFTVAGLWSFGTAREPRAFGVTLGFEY
ncbi:MAG: TonB-dependent receptor [Rhodospirillaceae bacterium]|nr:MAG: TonB-dependent receptor [Rhodospirillaceae bacterium]